MKLKAQLTEYLKDRFIQRVVTNHHGVIVNYRGGGRDAVIDLIRRIKAEKRMLVTDNEAYQIYMLTKNTAKVDGDVAELGCYEGGSTRLICEAKGDRPLHVFDTFDGLPSGDERFKENEYPASFEAVQDYLKGYKNVRLYRGFFSVTAEPLKHQRFAFVHLDADIYQSTIDGLQFFYPRMNKGGVILSHDYIIPKSTGVRRAFDEFFANKPEVLVEMSGSQVLVVKL